MCEQRALKEIPFICECGFNTIDAKRAYNHAVEHEMNCPIKLDKIHCQNCYFIRDGKCEYSEIVNEIPKKISIQNRPSV